MYYPLFNPKFNTDNIVAEHETFHAGVESLKDYLVSCLPAGTTWGYNQKSTTEQPQTFDSAQFRGLIDAFATPLADHVSARAYQFQARMLIPIFSS